MSWDAIIGGLFLGGYVLFFLVAAVFFVVFAVQRLHDKSQETFEDRDN